MISVIIGALLPVVVTLALGMLAGWHRDYGVDAARSLNHMVLVYALPLALFCRNDKHSQSGAYWRLAAAHCSFGCDGDALPAGVAR